MERKIGGGGWSMSIKPTATRIDMKMEEGNQT